jgi:hypothetical protein
MELESEFKSLGCRWRNSKKNRNTYSEKQNKADRDATTNGDVDGETERRIVTCSVRSKTKENRDATSSGDFLDQTNCELSFLSGLKTGSFLISHPTRFFFFFFFVTQCRRKGACLALLEDVVTNGCWKRKFRLRRLHQYIAAILGRTVSHRIYPVHRESVSPAGCNFRQGVRRKTAQWINKIGCDALRPGFNSRRGQWWDFSLRHRVHTGSGAHPASYPVGTGSSYFGGKAAGAWR